MITSENKQRPRSIPNEMCNMEDLKYGRGLPLECLDRHDRNPQAGHFDEVESMISVPRQLTLKRDIDVV